MVISHHCESMIFIVFPPFKQQVSRESIELKALFADIKGSL